MKIRLLLALVLMTFSVFGQNIPSYVPTNGLVGWWPFNGNADDESGNGNNGTVNGATLTSDRFGGSNSAYSFDGIDNYIKLLFNPVSNPTDFTVSVWVKSNASISTNPQCIFYDGGPSEYHLDIGANGTNGLLEAGIKGGSNSWYGIYYDMLPEVNIWHNYILSYSNNNVVSLYVDGQLNGISTNTSGLWAYSIDETIFGGRRLFSGLPEHPLDGSIDDIGIWNRALTQQEITNLYNASLPNTSIPIFNCPGAFMSPQLASGLVGWWPFCGDADDESGNGNNGTVNGATLTSDRFGNGNSAYEFDGVNNKIGVSHSNSLNSFPLTISAWFTTTSSQQHLNLVNKYACLILDGYSLRLNYGRPSAYYYGSNGSYVNFDSLGTPPALSNDGNWHNAIMTIDANGVNYYLDGIRILNRTFVGTGSGNGNAVGTTEDLFFGFYPLGVCGATYNPYYSGILDDIGIWNRALDSSEVAQLYNTGLCTQTIAGSCDTLIFNANITGFNPVTYANQVKVYPNPASDNLVIDCGSNFTGLNGYSMRITNLLGQTVYNSPVTAQITNIQLNPPTWVNGTYVVQFVHPNGTLVDTKRIIIQ
jgi:hypothetical protein